MNKILIVLIVSISSQLCSTQNAISQSNKSDITPAAYRTQVYLPLLKGKRVGIFANHTATIGNKHLVDTLLSLGIKITKAFGPEHGFRGKADAGSINCCSDDMNV